MGWQSHVIGWKAYTDRCLCVFVVEVGYLDSLFRKSIFSVCKHILLLAILCTTHVTHIRMLPICNTEFCWIFVGNSSGEKLVHGLAYNIDICAAISVFGSEARSSNARGASSRMPAECVICVRLNVAWSRRRKRRGLIWIISGRTLTTPSVRFTRRVF